MPLHRAYSTTADDRLVRELILQLKTGAVSAEYFRDKFAVEIGERFADALHDLETAGMLTHTPDRVELTRAGLLQVDSLLPEFYAPEHRNARYT